jgi:hypothetical protein
MAKGDPRPPLKPAPARKPVTARPVTNRPVTRPARIPKSSAPPLTSRTATLDDPLTTSLLAEVARRPTTVDVAPEQIAEVMTIARGDRESDDPT